MQCARRPSRARPSRGGVPPLRSSWQRHSRSATSRSSSNSHGFSKNSCFILDEDNTLRRQLVWFVTWSAFDNFILLAILANSVLLAIPTFQISMGEDLATSSPADWSYMINVETFEPDPAKSFRNELLASSEWFFTVAFLVECILKVGDVIYKV